MYFELAEYQFVIFALSNVACLFYANSQRKPNCTCESQLVDET